jgi:hypothetical protein
MKIIIRSLTDSIKYNYCFCWLNKINKCGQVCIVNDDKPIFD